MLSDIIEEIYDPKQCPKQSLIEKLKEDYGLWVGYDYKFNLASALFKEIKKKVINKYKNLKEILKDEYDFLKIKYKYEIKELKEKYGFFKKDLSKKYVNLKGIIKNNYQKLKNNIKSSKPYNFIIKLDKKLDDLSIKLLKKILPDNIQPPYIKYHNEIEENLKKIKYNQVK